jgi:hypothetical protein
VMAEENVPIEELLAGINLDPTASWSDDQLDDIMGNGSLPVNWRTLRDEDAPQVWEQLQEWVRWFCTRYAIPDATIPVCWWRHGSLSEELSALRTAWLVSFDETDVGYGPIGWHERLAVALPRLRHWYHGECSAGHQVVARSRTWSDATADESWQQWIGNSHA